MSESEYGGNKPQKVRWMINNVGPEPSLDIIRQANKNGWLCKNKDGTGGWNDFLTDGLDALHGILAGQGNIGQSSAAAMDQGFQGDGSESPPFRPVSPPLSDYFGPGFEEEDDDDGGGSSKSASSSRPPLSPGEFNQIRGRGSTNEREAQLQYLNSLIPTLSGKARAEYDTRNLKNVQQWQKAYDELYTEYMGGISSSSSSSEQQGLFGQQPQQQVPMMAGDDFEGSSFVDPQGRPSERTLPSGAAASTAITPNITSSRQGLNQLDESIRDLVGTVQTRATNIRNQLQREFAQMQATQAPDVNSVAASVVRRDVRNMLMNLCFGNYLADNLRGEGGMPVESRQSAGIPELDHTARNGRRSNLGVRPGMVRIYSPGATRILQEQGLLGEGERVQEMAETQWQAFTVAIASASGLPVDYYFQYDDYNRGQNRVYYAVIPQDNMLFNATPEQYDHWVQNYVNSRVRWIVQEDENNRNIEQGYRALARAYRISSRMDEGRTPPGPRATTAEIVYGIPLAQRMAMRAQAVSDYVFTQAFRMDAQARANMLPIELIILEHVRLIQDIRNAHTRLNQLLSRFPNWMNPEGQGQSWSGRIRSLFGGSTPRQLIEAQIELIWAGVSRWHSWYAGTVAPRSPEKDDGILPQNMTFGGRWRESTDPNRIINPLEMAIVEFPAVIRDVVADLYLLEGGRLRLQQGRANLEAMARAQEEFSGSMQAQAQARQTNNFFQWIGTNEGKAWVETLPQDPVERAQQIALRLGSTLDFSTGRPIRAQMRSDEQARRALEAVDPNEELPLDPNSAAARGAQTLVENCMDDICSTMASPLYQRGREVGQPGNMVWLYRGAGQQAVAQLKSLQASSSSSNDRVQQLPIDNPIRGYIVAVPGDMPPPGTPVSDPQNPIPLGANQYVVQIQPTRQEGSGAAPELRLMNTAEIDAVEVIEVGSGRNRQYINPGNWNRRMGNGTVLYPNYDQAMMRRARTQSYQRFDILQAISDYQGLSPEVRQRQIDVMTQRVYEEFTRSSAGTEQQAILARRVNHILARQRAAAGRLRGRSNVEQARRMQKQFQAMEGQHSGERQDSALQSVLFHAYQIYNEQFELLERTWRELHALNPGVYRDVGGQRLVAMGGKDGWDNPNSAINQQPVGASRGFRNPSLRNRLPFVSSFRNWFNSLLHTVGLTRLQLSRNLTPATAARLWNNGIPLTFVRFIQTFTPELSPPRTLSELSSSAAATTSGSEMGINQILTRAFGSGPGQFRTRTARINNEYHVWEAQQLAEQERQRVEARVARQRLIDENRAAKTEQRAQERKGDDAEGSFSSAPRAKRQRSDPRDFQVEQRQGNRQRTDGDTLNPVVEQQQMMMMPPSGSSSSRSSVQQQRRDTDDEDDENNDMKGGRRKRKKKTRRKKSKYNKMRGGKKKTRRKRGGKNKSRKKKGGERDLTEDQCKNKFREHKICGDKKKTKYLKFSRKNHPDKNPTDGGKAFQALNACLQEHWEGEMNKLNEDNFGCDEAKTDPVKAVAEPTRMAQQAETDTSKPAGNVVPAIKDGTKLGYKATDETHLGCRKAVTDAGQEYWYNSHHETTYNKNSEVCGGTVKELRLQNKPLDEKYEDCDTAITPAGEKYYYNRNTKARTYDKDDGTCKKADEPIQSFEQETIDQPKPGPVPAEQTVAVSCKSKKDCQDGQICYGEKGAKVCGTVEDAKAAGKAKGDERRAEAAATAAAAQEVSLSDLPQTEEEKAAEQETELPKPEQPVEVNPEEEGTKQTGDVVPVGKKKNPL